MAYPKTTTLWPTGSNEEPLRGPMPFDAQKVGKFLKNFEDKNILINLDANGGRLRGLILELTTKYHLDITTD